MANVNGLLSPQQQTFVSAFAKSSGYDPAVVGAWLRNEEPLASQNTDPAGHGRYNFLNIGITDSQPYGANAKLWADPETAGRLSGAWALGKYKVPGYGGAASSLSSRLAAAVGGTPAQQIKAIQTSGWASGGETALPSLYQKFSGVTIPQTPGAAGQQLALASGVNPKAATTASNGSTQPAQGNTFLDFLTAKMGAQAQNNQQGARVPVPTMTEFLNQTLPQTGTGNLLGYIQKSEAGTPTKTPITVTAGQGVKATPTTAAAIDLAKQFLGTPYKFGGADPSTGFDCSGLVQYTLGKQGIKVPRTAAEQFHSGTPVNKNNLTPGDVLFFVGSDGTQSQPGHEGMYLGNGQFIEAPHTGANIRISNLNGRTDFVGARSFTQ